VEDVTEREPEPKLASIFPNLLKETPTTVITADMTKFFKSLSRKYKHAGSLCTCPLENKWFGLLHPLQE